MFAQNTYPMFWNKKSSHETIHVTDDSFNEVVAQSPQPVLVDFFADWCGPCKILGPIIDELAEEYQDKALVVKVDTEQNPKLSQHFQIKSIPTIMLFNKGYAQERFHGLVPKPNLEEILNEYIAGTDEKGRLISSEEE